MLFIFLQIQSILAQTQQNFIQLSNQPSLEIQVSLYTHINQPFILAASEQKFENIFYSEGQDRIPSLNYDHESFITNNDIHVIFTDPSDELYIYAGYLNQSYNQYGNFSLKINNEPKQCASICVQSGNFCSNQTPRKCICKPNNFGEFCQFQRQIAILSIEYDIIVKPFQWAYIAFQTQQLNKNESLKLRIKDQSAEMLMGLGVDGIANHQIPNMHYDAYIIPKKLSIQIYQLKGDLIYYESMCDNCTILNIGFYNNHSFPILFYFDLYEKEQIIESDPYHLKLILQSICLICFILITYLIFKKMKQRQQIQQIVLVQRQFRRRRRRIQENQQKPDGFTLEFIQTYFPQIYYLDLIEKYPSLNEFVECVVCLESMAPPEQGRLTERDHIDHCSITPCFHLFHQHCLFKWLQTQKCCPLCRRMFTENEIKSKPWISLNNDISIRETSRCNPFVQRMKTRSENTQTSDIPLILESEQAESQPKEQVNIPLKSARDLIIK